MSKMLLLCGLQSSCPGLVGSPVGSLGIAQPQTAVPTLFQALQHACVRATGAGVGAEGQQWHAPPWQIPQSAVALQPERSSCFPDSELGDGNENGIYEGNGRVL